MYKIIIADDEQIVRDGIKKLINWDSLGLDLVGDAEDGEQAYDLIKKYRPDVAMVDINMPHMDGLKLIKLIKEEAIDCEFLIVTGYDDFNYAREALRLGVNDYILKPLTKNELTEILSNMVCKLTKKGEKVSEYNNLSKQFKESIQAVQSKYLNGLIYGDLNLESLSVDLSKLNLNSFYSWYSICLLDSDSILNGNDKLNENNIKLTSFALLNIATEILKNLHVGILFKTEENETAILFYSNNENRKQALNEFIDVLTNIKATCKKYMKITISVGIGTLEKKIEDISESYYKARSAIESRFLIGNDALLFGNESTNEFKDFADGLLSIEDSILCSIRLLNDKVVEREFENLTTYMKLQKLDKNQCINEFVKLVILMIEKFIDMNVDMKNILDRKKNITTTISGFKNIDGIRLWVFNLYKKCHEFILVNTDMNNMYVIKIKEFIYENYSKQEFSYKDLCDYVHLSPSYLSLIMKEQLGKTFIDYLTETRMQNAIRLLKTTSLKSYEVAYEVGYSDPHYFSSVFKKIFEESPIEYRNKCI